ncbi:hypothetical protein F511_45633 [Dorcoceras hygrometricum]|uniref:HTH araC/xylS-type domain-containing protein n=1 Tax=Dorcoceras hygrometricum TaxID=472368 RepID=A0A2Z6ZVJ0_9LAMI|nr:hypothetical protein F511_45633 [Dorcoceras hygrometricum]
MLRKQSSELPDHLHDRYELVYIHQGEGIFFIDQTWYEKKPGDLFVIPGNTIHHSLPRDDNPIVSSALFFAPALLSMKSADHSYNSLLCFEYARRKRSYRIELPESLKAITEHTLLQIQQELTERKSGYQEAVKLISCQYLLQINRYTESIRVQKDLPAASVGPYWMKEILHQIDEHPEQEASLSRLAERANVSAAHFSRVFRQLTTMNVTQYVNAKRIIRAKELLLMTDDSILEISERCGYETPTHFYRVFKALTGITPNKYRQTQTQVKTH